MTCHARIESYLSKNQVPFGVHRHLSEPDEPASAKGAHLIDQVVIQASLAVVLGVPVLLVYPKTREIDLPRLGALLGDPGVRLANADELAEAIPGCAADAIPPFGNLYGLTVYADRSLEGDRAVFFAAGDHTTTLSIGYSDFTRLAEPIIAEFTHMGHQPAVRSDMLAMGGL